MFDLGNGCGFSWSSRPTLKSRSNYTFNQVSKSNGFPWGSCLHAAYLRGFSQLLTVLLLGLLQPAVCLKHTQKATRLAQTKNVYRHFATDPSAWHLIHMPIAERLGPAPAPTPFRSSQKTARACLWSPANYSSLKRGEKLYLCCQLLEKHKDFCGLKNKKKREWESVCVAGGGRQHTHEFIGVVSVLNTGKGKGESPGHRLPGSSATRGTRRRVSAWCLQLPFVPPHVPSYLKVATTLKIDPNVQLNRPWALGPTALYFSFHFFPNSKIKNKPSRKQGCFVIVESNKQHFYNSGRK